MRSNLDQNKAQRLDIQSAQYGINRVPLIANIVLVADGPAFNFFEASGANRDVTLPTNKRGAMVGVVNYGASNSLIVKTPAGSTLATLQVSEGALFVCSGQEWRWFAYSPTAYLDPTEISSPDTTITVTTVGNAVTLEVNEPAVDHNALLNFVADKHVAHSGVSITAGSGLSGGGTIDASRTLSLDIVSLTGAAPVLADSFAFYDLSLTANRKATLTDLNGILDHNGLLNYSANRHIDHTGVSISAGEGLTGGGAIDSTKTISLAINSLAADTPIAASVFAFYDTVAGEHNKVTLSGLQSAIFDSPTLVVDSITHRVGIGTSTPESLLELVKANSGTLGAWLVLKNSAAEASGNYTGIGFTNTNGTAGYVKGGIYYRSISPYTYGRGDIVFVQNSTENSSNATLSNVKMVIGNNGKIGIGGEIDTGWAGSLINLSGAADQNVVTVQNTVDATGQSAIMFRDYNGFEHGAMGFGNVRTAAGIDSFTKYMYIEMSTSDASLPIGFEIVNTDFTGNVVVGATPSVVAQYKVLDVNPTGKILFHQFIKRNQLVLSTDGKIGINTETPQYGLDINIGSSRIVFSDVGINSTFGTNVSGADLVLISNAASKSATLKSTGQFQIPENIASTSTTTGGLVVTGGAGFGGKVSTVASATATAGLNVPHGAEPTSPVNGDVWTTTAGLFSRINGATIGPLVAAISYGTGVVTALGINVGADGAFVVKGGALGSPSSAGTMPNFIMGSSGLTFNGSTAGQFRMDGASSTFIMSPIAGSVIFGSNTAATGVIMTINVGFEGARINSSGGVHIGDTNVDPGANNLEVQGTINSVAGYKANGTAGVTTFGPAAVASITVKNGIVTAIS